MTGFMRTVALCVVGWALAGLAHAQSCPLKRPVSVGVVPQQAPSDLARAWLPILESISKASGCTFRFATAPTIPEFEQRVGKGDYDIAYMNPYHYTVFSVSPGYRAFAREKERRLKGLIVVARGSAIKDVADLAGREVAFPSPAAFAATIIPLAELGKAGIEVKPVYVASHDSVYLNVSRGFYPAGGGIVRTFNAIAPDVREKLEVLWESQEYAPHAFAALPALDPGVRDAFFLGMRALESDVNGRAMLEVLRFKGVEAAVDADWDSIRALNLQLLATPVAR